MFLSKKLVALPLMAAILVAGCSSAAATPVPPTPAAATPTAAVAGASPVAAGSPAASSATIVLSGAVVAAGSNGMTVYTFAKDTANSGTSACTTGCITKWPAVTVPTGTTPTAGTGVTGTLATIKRADDGTTQVTYNGLPLYFYSGDKAPGDTNGSYTGWNLVKP